MAPVREISFYIWSTTGGLVLRARQACVAAIFRRVRYVSTPKTMLARPKGTARSSSVSPLPLSGDKPVTSSIHIGTTSASTVNAKKMTASISCQRARRESFFTVGLSM
jgi:hypothetical protein